MDTILFSGTNSQEFKNEILEGVKKYLQDLLSQQKEKETSDYLTRHQVAEMLSIDISTVHNWTKKGKLIPYGMGGRIYYKRSEIEQAIIPL